MALSQNIAVAQFPNICGQVFVEVKDIFNGQR